MIKELCRTIDVNDVQRTIDRYLTYPRIFDCEKQMGDRTSLTAIEYAPLRVQYWNTPAFPAALVDVE
jgi:hypothetical protein